MKYVGSKNRIAKYLAPIIQGYIDREQPALYWEPFVGGANMIDKIRHPNKVGTDRHPELIALLKAMQNKDLAGTIPVTITEAEYNRVNKYRGNYPMHYVGLVGFCATFGAKWFGGYARGTKADGTPRDMPAEAIRNLKLQAATVEFQETLFEPSYYDEVDIFGLKRMVIYCDPPYKTGTQYDGERFNNAAFEIWARKAARQHTVLISENYMDPAGFELLWEMQHKSSLGKDAHVTKTERLYKAKPWEGKDES